MPFAVLMICTGNVCRSPAAQRLLAPRVPSFVSVSSAGLRALVGRGVDGPTAAALRERDVDPDGHEARLFTPQLLQEADLVLTADSGQRSAILNAAPTAMRATFTMREFARLGADLPALPEPDEHALRWRVHQIAARRGFVPPAEPGGDDVGDPFGAPLPVARAAVEQVAQVMDGVLAALGLAGDQRGASRGTIGA